MTDSDAVRRVGLALPRTYERQVRGRWKLKVGPIVYVAFSRDELDMGFGFPKAERDGLIASDPDTFFLPPVSDLRYQWVCAHLSRLDDDEMRELVTDAWRMCTPRMLHDLPEMPEPAMAAYRWLDLGEYGELRPLLAPVRALRRRRRVAARPHEGPRPPPRARGPATHRGRGTGRAGLPLVEEGALARRSAVVEEGALRLSRDPVRGRVRLLGLVTVAAQPPRPGALAPVTRPGEGFVVRLRGLVTVAAQPPRPARARPASDADSVKLVGRPTICP